MIHFNSNRLLNKVLQSLEDKQPLSIVRLGDGESRTLNGFNDLPALEMIMKKLLGEMPSVYEIGQIQKSLVEAYTETDFIGMPVGKKLEKEDKYWSRAFTFLADAIGQETLYKKEIVDMDFCYDWMTAGYYDKLFENVKVLNYVSCRNLDKAFKKRYGIETVNSYIVPPEMKFAPQYKGKKFYPYHFNQVRLWMKATPLEGHLFLYGAGVAGKVFGTWSRSYGAIALDIGSVFDAWYGAKTRGPGRGANAIDNTYKL